MSQVIIEVDVGGYSAEKVEARDTGYLLTQVDEHFIIRGNTDQLLSKKISSNNHPSKIYKKFIRFTANEGLLKFTSKYGIVINGGDNKGRIDEQWRAQKNIKILNDYKDDRDPQGFLSSLKNQSVFNGKLIPDVTSGTFVMEHNSLLQYMIFEIWESFETVPKRVKTCPWCGKTFTLGIKGKKRSRSDIKYCKDGCRTMASRHRNNV